MRQRIRIIAAILVMALLLAFPALALSPGTARVTGNALRFRAAPSLDAEVLRLADKGTVVEIQLRQPDGTATKANLRLNEHDVQTLKRLRKALYPDE